MDIVAVAVLLGALAAVPTWAVPALGAPADLDPSFGKGGRVSVQVNVGCRPTCVEFGGSYADALVVQPDGGIVLGGGDVNHFNPVPLPADPPLGALVRLRPSGALDASFGGRHGIEDTPFRVEQIGVDARGGLLAQGSGKGGLGVSRYTPDGVLDGAFAPGGVRWFAQPRNASIVQRDAQGRLLVAVSSTRFNFDVRRLLGSGALDRSFGRAGIVHVRVPRSPRETDLPPGSLGPPLAEPLALSAQRDGSVLIAFATAAYNSNEPSGYDASQFFLQRLTSAGRVDTSFGRHGLARLEGAVEKIAVAPDGRIMLVAVERSQGRTANRHLPTRPPRGLRPEREELVLADYTSAGRLDRAFGRDGIARTSLSTSREFRPASATSIAFDAAGNTIVAGRQPIRTVDVPAGVAFLARYTPHGRDCSFGARGILTDPEMDGISAVAVQPNGRIVVAGGAGAFTAARYLGRGIPRTCRGEPSLSRRSAFPSR
jgi:uncharacterized delta-60 repeat protein